MDHPTGIQSDFEAFIVRVRAAATGDTNEFASTAQGKDLPSHERRVFVIQFFEHSLRSDILATKQHARQDWQHSKSQVRIEEFVKEFPELLRDGQVPLELIVREYEVCVECGVHPDIASYLKRFPDRLEELSTALSELAPTLAPNDETGVYPGDEFVETHSFRPEKQSNRSSTTNRAGTRFGDYELLEEIARGGMGVVYKARQIKLNRIVAMKMILAGTLASEEDVRRFYTEAESAARLDHPGIVPIYEVNHLDNQHFYSMAFVDGSSLARQIAKGPLDQREAARLIRSIAESIEYAHRQGIIHRDLKPQNILLTADGQPKVTDFGLAKLIQGNSGLTASGEILGTPSYMPPEQASGRVSEVGPLSDVYSLGALFYCLLTGRPPFQAASVLETLKQVVSSEPVRPSLLNPSVNRDLETICLKCLEKEPSRRLTSCQELVEELDRFLRGEPIKSRRISLATRFGRWCRRNPLATALSTSVIVLFALAGIVWGLAKEADRSRKLASTRERIQAIIDSPELTETYLKLGEAVIGELQGLDPSAIRPAADRLRLAFVNQIETMVRRAKLDNDELRQLESAIAVAERFQPERAAEFSKLLQQRTRTWNSIFQFKPPFDDATSVFDPSEITVEPEGRLLLKSNRRSPSEPPVTATAKTDSTLNPELLKTIIRPRAELVGDVRIELGFDESWRTASRLGAVCNMNGDHGYAFVLTNHTPAETVARDDLNREQWTAQLIRNDVILREQSVPTAWLTPSSLRLTATRYDDRISLQINDATPIIFDDAFALPRNRPGSIGLIVPAEVKLARVAASQRPRTTSSSPLDKADELFSEGKFEEALTLYQDLAVTESEPQTVQETRFKAAACLMQLRRFDESSPLFMQLFAESGDRWPILAGSLLWVSLIREKRTDDAEAVYERLSTQFPFERLAALVSDDVRREILAAYRPPRSARVIKRLTLTPAAIRDTERMWIVQKLLQPSGPAFEEARAEVFQTYLLAGDLDRALRIIDEALTERKSEWALNQRIRLLRYKGESDAAIREINQELYTSDGELRYGVDLNLLLNRIRCHSDLGQWDQVDAGLQELKRNMSVLPLEQRSFLESDVQLIEGLMRSKYGDHDSAIAIWRNGIRRDPKTGQPIAEGTVEYHMLRSLCGDLDLSDAKLFMSKFESPTSGSVGTMFQSAMTPEAIVPALRDIWNSPKGREWRDRGVFQRLPDMDDIRVRVSLVALEYCRLNAFHGQMTTEQSDVVWELVQTTFQSLANGKTLSIGQLLPLGLSWKGNTSILAWGAVESSLPQNLRAQFAYLLAHRYLRLGKPQDSRKFLSIAKANSLADSSLARLSALELELLEQGSGRLHVQSQLSESTRVTVIRDGQSVQTLIVGSEVSESFSAGKYELRIESPADRHLKLSASQIEIRPGETNLVEIISPWDHPTSVIPLAGIVSSPSRIERLLRWQLIHRDSPNEFATTRINPAHSWLARGGVDGHVRLRQVNSEQFQKVLIGMGTQITSLAWHPREPKLAAGTIEGQILVWNTESGEREVIARGHNGLVRDLSWSPDGQHFVSVGDWGDGKIQIWTDQLIPSHSTRIDGMNSSVCWSPDSKLLASTGSDSKIRVWDLACRPAHVFDNPELIELFCVTWSPDGTMLASCGRSNTVRMWNFATKSAGPTFVPSDFFVTSLDWSADGSSIAVGTQDGYVAIHDSAAGKQHVRSSQVQPITVIDWSPDASQLFSWSWDSVVRIWPRDLQSPQLQHFMPLQPGTLEWNADQTLCVVNETHSGRQLELRDQNGRFVREFPLPYPQLTNVAWSPDGRWIAIAPDQTKAVSIWNAQDGTVTATVPLEESPAIQLAWNSQSNRLAIGCRSTTLRIVDLSGKVSSITNLPHQPRSIDWKPNSSMLAVVYEQANTSHVLQFWDADSLQSLPLTIPVTGYLNRIRWCPIGNRFAILVNHQPLIWDVDLRRAAVCTGHPGSCVDLCWNPDGHHLATVGRDKTTKIWNADGDCLQTLTGHRGWLTRVQWGKTDHLITSELDWVQHRWNAKTGRLQQTFIWLPNQNFLSLGPTGEILYSSSDALSQINIVVERPAEQQKHAVPEFCSWEEFERLLGFPPLRPSPLPN